MVAGDGAASVLLAKLSSAATEEALIKANRVTNMMESRQWQSAVIVQMIFYRRCRLTSTAP